MRDYHTLEDFDFRDKTVLLRVDINCPLDKETLKITNDTRIKRIVPTVRELIEKRAKVVILAHQSRKKKWDFIPLEQHSKKLNESLNSPVKYVDDVIGESAKKAIIGLKPGEILLLGNVRELDSETANLDMFEHANGELVSELSPLIDYYLCDAFAVAHRSHCSLVGFPLKVPSALGRLMEKELCTLNTIFGNPRRPFVFIIGGAKLDSVSKMIDHVLETGMADLVILTGLAGNAFLLAGGIDLGEASTTIIRGELAAAKLQDIKSTILKYGQKILLPIDVAVERDGSRVSISVEDLPIKEPIMDIGDASIEKFKKIIISSKTSFMSGPAGIYEKERFKKGTRSLMNAMIESGGQSIIGGGHTINAADSFNFTNRFSYVSTGGGALEAFIIGQSLPAVDALKYSYKKIKC
ncbi:MAG: phosphoglycerate kinase [archaeon]|nr:phosphoglycerate kinase [archaeon]